MKILVWCPVVSLGGGLQLLRELVPAVARHPDVGQVLLVLPKKGIETDSAAWSHESGLAIRLIDSSRLQTLIQPQTYGSGKFYRNRLVSAVLRRLFRRVIGRLEARQLWAYSRQFDVVYAFWPHGRSYQPAQVPVVCTYQDTTFLDFPEIMGIAATQQERSNAESWLNHAAHVVVSSEAVKSRLVHHFGSQLGQSTVIYHNILPRRSIASVASPLESYRLPERYMLYPANINPHKNHDVLLIALSRFARRSDCPLVLIGEGTQILDAGWDWRNNVNWQQDRLVGLAKRLNLKSGEDFFALGYVPDAAFATLLARATALMMPSLSEGGGSYPVEEALAHGIPVLCSDIPVMREHLAARSAKVVWFDPLSPDSIANGMNHLLDHYETYRSAAVAGMNDPRPTWDQVAAQYVGVFQQVIARNKAPVASGGTRTF